MPWPPEDPDMWAVEAAFGKHNRKETRMPEKHPEPSALDMVTQDTGPFADPTINEALRAPKQPSLQVAGTHYAVMAIDPSRFAMANDYDADAFSILKYLSRHRAKDGREGIEKAMSFIDIRLRNRQYIGRPRRAGISINTYIEANGFDHLTAMALRDLHHWHHFGGTNGPDEIALRISIKAVLNSYG